MNKYIRTIAVALTILIAATTFTRAQDAPITNQPTLSKFTDIAQVNFSSSVNHIGIEMGFRNVFSFRNSNNFAVGFGIGLEPDNINTVSVPLSADLRWYFNQKNKAITPLLNLYGGYSFNSDNGNSTFLGLNFGINIALTNRTSIELALGYKLDHYGFIRSLSDRPSQDNYLTVPFTIGVAF